MTPAETHLWMLWQHCGCSWSALDARVRCAPGAVVKIGAMRALRARVVEGDPALDLQSRSLTLTGLEDALAWLSIPGVDEPEPRSVADDVMHRLETVALVRRVVRCSPRMPRREMQELVRRGPAIIPVVGALLAGGAAHVVDPLWLVVVLGELRHADALPMLVGLLGDGRDEVAAAAAEGLTKIGPPAFPCLEAAADHGTLTRRLYAYSALGALHTDDAYVCLLTGLERSPELGDVIARALAQHGRVAAVEALVCAGARAPDWMRREFAAAIEVLRAPPAATDPTTRDWRLRYRRLPRLGWAVPPTATTFAALVSVRRRRAARAVRDPALLALGATRVAAAGRRADDHVCATCGGALWRPTGVPLCRHTAVRVLALQSAMLARWRARGWRDTWQAIDSCDRADLRLMRRSAQRVRRPDRAAWSLPGVAASARRSDDAAARGAVARGTLYWMVAVGHEDLQDAAHYLTLVRGDVDALYGRYASIQNGTSLHLPHPSPSPQSFS